MNKKALLYTSVSHYPLLLSIVDATYRYNLAFLRIYPKTPSIRLFCSYKRENNKSGFEHFQTYDNLLDTHEGDCEDLGCADAAYETFHGREAYPLVALFELPNKKRILHCLTQYKDGNEFDPSIYLGMPVSEGIKRIKDVNY